MIKRNDMMSVKDVQEMLGIPLLGAIPEDEQVGGGKLCVPGGDAGHYPAGGKGPFPMNSSSPQVIVSTNRGEPLVLQKTLSLSGIAYENAARRLVGGSKDLDLDPDLSLTILMFFS